PKAVPACRPRYAGAPRAPSRGRARFRGDPRRLDPERKEGRMSHYYDADPLKILGAIKKQGPAEVNRFGEMDGVAGRDNGKSPRKSRELIALAVACTTQCPYCLDVHTKNAKKAGATREEVAETSLIAAALRAGAAVTHGALAVKLFDKA